MSSWKTNITEGSKPVVEAPPTQRESVIPNNIDLDNHQIDTEMELNYNNKE